MSPTGWRRASTPTTRSGRRISCRSPGARRMRRRRRSATSSAEGPASPRIGVEPGFLPMDGAQALQAAFPNAPITDAGGVLERLRAVKTPAELALLRDASERISASMQATIAAAREGIDQGRDHRAAPARGDRARAAVRILPADARRLAQPRHRRTRPGPRARCCRSTRAATSRATSATSAGWACWASRMANWSICWPRSRRCSRPPSPRCGPGAPGAEVDRRRRGGAGGLAEPGLHRLLRAWHGRHHPRGAVPDDQPSGRLRRHRRRQAAAGRNGPVRSRRRCCIPRAASSSSRTRSR